MRLVEMSQQTALTCRCLVTALCLAISACGERVELGPGVFAPAAPQQISIEQPAFRHNGVLLHPRASFNVTGKLLAKRRYRFDDLAAVAPWDFALGWDLMSAEAVLEWVHLTQGDRFLFRQLLHRDLPLRRIEQSSANVHVIPANVALEAQLADMPTGVITRMTGVLVDVQDDGLSRPTSLSRGDTGPGACEILYVESIEVVRKD